MALTIRNYTPEDYEILLEMETELIDAMSKIDPHKRFRSRKDLNAQKYFDAILKDISRQNGRILLAEVDGKTVGYLMGKVVDRTEVDSTNKYPAVQGYIEGLYVDEKYRSQGISSRLIEEIEKYFRERHCDYSSIACVAVNKAARNLYTKAGYGEQYIDYLKKL